MGSQITLDELTITPFGLNFGTVLEDTTAPTQAMTLEFTGGGGWGACQINTSDSRFTFVITQAGTVVSPLAMAGDFPIYALNTDVIYTMTVTFIATATLGSVTATCLAAGISVSGGWTPNNTPFPGGPTLVATVIGEGTESWTVAPSSIDFGSLKIGTSSAPSTITVTNTGSIPVVIDTIDLIPTDFTLTGLPTLPATIGVGDDFTFQVTCNSTFRGINTYNPGISITSDHGLTQSVTLIYTGFSITPAFTLTGATQGVLFGLSGAWVLPGSSLPLPFNYVIQSLASLASEAPASWTKMHDFGNPSSYTYANRMFMRTECYGEVTATLTSTGIISDVVVTRTDTKTRDASNDDTGIPSTMVFDVETNGEIHKLVLSIAANAGILCMSQYNPCYETRGSVYESK
jgi:hypothetical protein